MATDQAKHRKWADAQVAALLELGVDLADAQRSVKWTLDTMPEDADPNTWIPTAEQLYHDPSTPEAIQTPARHGTRARQCRRSTSDCSTQGRKSSEADC